MYSRRIRTGELEHRDRAASTSPLQRFTRAGELLTCNPEVGIKIAALPAKADVDKSGG